jgi:hypothetical protein
MLDLPHREEDFRTSDLAVRREMGLASFTFLISLWNGRAILHIMGAGLGIEKYKERTTSATWIF